MDIDYDSLTREEIIEMINEQKAALKEKDRVILEKEQIIKLRLEFQMLREEGGYGYLTTKGLPPLGPFEVYSNQRSSTSQYLVERMNINHFTLHLDNNSFKSINNYRLTQLNDDNRSMIWLHRDTHSLPHWSHINDIIGFVQLVLTDVIRLAGLRNTVLSLREFTLTLTDHNRSNLLIFRARGNAIGVCMVIKPSRDGDDLDYTTNRESKRALSFHYQLLMYMQQLRFTHGVQQVFGIITTYKQWRICWLPEASELASATTEPEPQPLASSTSNTVPVSSDLSTLYGSALYEYNQPALIEVLVSTLRKMASSTVIPVTTLLPTPSETGRKYGLISAEGTFTWQDLPLFLRLSYLMKPTDPLDKVYVLQDYGEGLDGRVWLAATASGGLTVVKMTRASVTVEAPLKKQRVSEEGVGKGQGEVGRYMHMYDRERELWRSVWGAESTVCRTFLNAYALLMPFAFHGWL